MQRSGKRNKQQGFTLLELLVVVGIIGILSAAYLSAAAPGFKAGRENAAVKTVNTILQDETNYQNLFQSVGYSADLGSLGSGATIVTPCVIVQPTAGCIMDPSHSAALLASATTPVNGYVYAYTPTASTGINTSFVLTATPVDQTQGRKSYYTTESGAVSYGPCASTPCTALTAPGTPLGQ